MLAKINRPQPTRLLAPEQGKNHCPAGSRPGTEDARQFQNGRCAGGVVIGAIVNIVSAHCRTNTQVIQMRGQQDNPPAWITTTENAYRIPREALFRRGSLTFETQQGSVRQFLKPRLGLLVTHNPV